MAPWSGWLHTPRGLLILLVTVVALPAATLVSLGVRLLQQDRELERQRRAEILQDASDRAVNALAREVAAAEARLADPAWPSDTPAAGSVHVVLTRGDMRIEPVDAVAFWPTPARLKEIPAAPFQDADAAELERRDLARALDIDRTLADSSDASLRAGALMRQARILRKMGRADDALQAYASLTDITSVSINGLPADLQARKTRCALLAERGDAAAVRREAAALEADLLAGRWRLDRQNVEYLDALLDQWLGSARRKRADRTAYALAVAWIHEHAAGANPALPGRGTHLLAAPEPLTIVWAATGDRASALIADTSYVEREWLSKAQRAAAPAAVSLPTNIADERAGRLSSPSVSPTATRTAADTGLPWTIAVSLPAGANAAQFEARRRTLLAALGAVLVLASAGGYVIVRARSREMTLARLQSDFVTAVSHEFRTPLTALLQFNDLLDESANLPPEKRRSYYQAQRRATERLHRLVESLLDFGRMEAGRRQYALERLDAGLLVRDVVDEFRGELDGRGLTVRFAADGGAHDVDADPEALARAVWNLLDNAAKYSGDGREIDAAVQHLGDAVSIAVRDRGIGIPAADQARIFQKFTRGAAATSRRIRGTGVGLAMVQHIVTGHRGSLKVESVENQGSTFTIVLPAARGSELGARQIGNLKSI